MKFGLFFEMSTPRPWGERSEKEKLDEMIEQIVLADKLGIEYVWMTEHHFMEEYCHLSAPEVALTAAAAVTKNIRLGHGVRHAPPRYNHPARVAETAAMLDLVSNGRVDLGFGSSGSEVEMAAFGISNDEKHQMTYEAVEHIADMMSMDPYPGHDGTYFSMPARNVLPKPLQKPHPPFWLACSARPTIYHAAEHGMGALCFSFLEASEAKAWVDDYYETFREKARPIGHLVNPNFAIFTGFGVHRNEKVAVERFLDGMRFFQFSLNFFYRGTGFKPGRFNLWEMFQEELRNKESELLQTENDDSIQRQLATSKSCIGSVDQVRQRLRDLRDAGVDQVAFVMQMGNNQHEHICESLELFAKEIMPEFQDEHEKREARKMIALEPYIEKAFGRIGGKKPLIVADSEIQRVGATNYIANYKQAGPVLGLISS